MKHATTVGIVLWLVAYCLFAAILYSEERVRVQVDPPAIGRGGNAWVTCWVPRHEDNRSITVGMPWHRTTYFDIEGAKAPKMFRFLLQDIPCLPVAAVICHLRTNKGEVLASKPVIVAGCENN